MILKRIKVLTLILVVLTGIVFVVLSMDHENKKAKPAQAFLNFDQNQIASFQVNNFTLGFLFKKDEDGSWLIKEIDNELNQSLTEENKKQNTKEENLFQKANSLEVVKALTYLMELRDLKPISTERTDPKVFEINPYSLHMILYDSTGAILDKIYIGKHGPDPMTSFLKKPDDNKVYLVNQDFRLLFFRNFEDWL